MSTTTLADHYSAPHHNIHAAVQWTMFLHAWLSLPHSRCSLAHPARTGPGLSSHPSTSLFTQLLLFYTLTVLFAAGALFQPVRLVSRDWHNQGAPTHPPPMWACWCFLACALLTLLIRSELWNACVTLICFGGHRGCSWHPIFGCSALYHGLACYLPLCSA